MAANFKACSVVDCNGNAHWTAKGAKGWCSKHYARSLRHGSPEICRTPPGEPLAWIASVALTHDTDECLIWPFGGSSGGYGQLVLAGRRAMAHRVVCEMAHGEAPSPDHQAAHGCGKGSAGCVNPGHLRWATRSENQMDRVSHGTSNRGERHAHTRLTEALVRRIRQMAETMPPKQIAAIVGVPPKRVSAVVRRATWGWLQ